MNTLDKKKKKLELEQDLSIQPDEVEVEEDIDIEDIEKYDSSFLDPSAEEIDIELDIVNMLKNIDDE
ncbi:MAG: hypothetical protein SPC26_05355 [Lactobacillus amylovorus]|nr:hypothetical protein [Lactobacillus amylovorus]